MEAEALGVGGAGGPGATAKKELDESSRSVRPATTPPGPSRAPQPSTSPSPAGAVLPARGHPAQRALCPEAWRPGPNQAGPCVCPPAAHREGAGPPPPRGAPGLSAIAAGESLALSAGQTDTGSRSVSRRPRSVQAPGDGRTGEAPGVERKHVGLWDRPHERSGGPAPQEAGLCPVSSPGRGQLRVLQGVLGTHDARRAPFKPPSLENLHSIK